MTENISTDDKLEELQIKVVDSLNELKEFQKDYGVETSEIVKRLTADSDLARATVELLLVMCGFEKVTAGENC